LVNITLTPTLRAEIIAT
jgi:hypothetical protein